METFYFTVDCDFSTQIIQESEVSDCVSCADTRVYKVTPDGKLYASFYMGYDAQEQVVFEWRLVTSALERT